MVNEQEKAYFDKLEEISRDIGAVIFNLFALGETRTNPPKPEYIDKFCFVESDNCFKAEPPLLRVWNKICICAARYLALCLAVPI